MWLLTIRSPHNQPVEYWVKPGKNTLGRKPENHIVISDESASRVHAEIYCQNELAMVYDLGSTNGTFVNRELITKPHVLKSGDQIRIGQHIISVDFRESGVTKELLASQTDTRKLTRDLLLESIDQNAVFMDAVASRLITILDLETALQEIAGLTKLAIGADKCEVILAEHFAHLSDFEIPNFIAKQAIEQHSVVLIPNLSAQCGRLTNDAGGPPIASILCIPVIIEQDVAALLYAFKSDPEAKRFDRHDVQLAVAISHQAALTIQRAQLIEKSQMFEQLAITDSLTGLYNRRHILHLAEIEFQRARRFQHSLSLIILDLDDLKHINDEYGHLAGDNALRAVAESGRKQLREVDSIGRFGGDEFIAILVETDLKGGWEVAERLRKSISETPVNTKSTSINIGASIGLATLSEKHSNITELLNDADKALMKAKKSGKYRVVAAE
jgi:diguanylate cyclase (GGDEF)-like protein